MQLLQPGAQNHNASGPWSSCVRSNVPPPTSGSDSAEVSVELCVDVSVDVSVDAAVGVELGAATSRTTTSAEHAARATKDTAATLHQRFMSVRVPMVRIPRLIEP